MSERDNWGSGAGEEFESQIQRFCEKCDNYKPRKVILGIHLGNECRVMRAGEQAIAVNNGLCTSARRGEWEGKMEQRYPSEPPIFTARLNLNRRRKR